MFAFIHIPKTAGSTIATILRHSFLTRHCDIRLGDDFAEPKLSAEILRRTKLIHWRLLSIAGHGVVPFSDLMAEFRDTAFYTFLREPITRCASEYQYLVQRNNLSLSFRDWIKTDRARNRITKKLSGQEDANAAIQLVEERIGYVGLVEHFDASLVMLRRWMNHPSLDIRYKPKNVMQDNSIKNDLLNDTSTRRLLREANDEDIGLYRHVTERVFADQIRRYGSNLERDVLEFARTNGRPRPFPRQLGSLLVRELIYKPLAPYLAQHASNRDRPEAA